MSGHTPGPWGCYSVEGPRDITLKRRHWMIGHNGGKGVAIAFGDEDAAPSPANAHLIAAAPRLKASLVKTLAAAVELHAHGIGCPDCPEDHEDTGEDCPMLQEAEAALAAAGGH